MNLWKSIVVLLSFIMVIPACKKMQDQAYLFDWKNATVYFMLTDRFHNADDSNDDNYDRTEPTEELRRFLGGDLKGITEKIQSGYFSALGVDALWFSPVNEQIHGFVDEGSGDTYAFHGYWIKDWTSIEPNWGTEADLKTLVETAHSNGIRVILDVIINHTGPVTEKDPVWPSDWVRTEPQCSYQDYESTVYCTLVKNLPDIITEQTKEVDLPPQLKEKWEAEGRLEKEMQELDAFFKRTGYPRTPRYYIIKWITDFIRKYGIDGFRIDTVKHTDESVWAELAKESKIAFGEWKKNHPSALQHGQEFFIVGETYNYAALNGKDFDFGDRKVNYFDFGFDSQINFGFKGDAQQDYETLFSRYSDFLNHGQLKGLTTMNYISSHDDSWPFDKERKRPYESATKLMLSPGQVQIYYGDETARPLEIEGAEGDVNLRGKMNWGENPELLKHWQKLGKFRNRHPAIGAGEHQIITEKPYVFSRTYNKSGFKDKVLVAIVEAGSELTVDVSDYFTNGSKLYDAYGDSFFVVSKGQVKLQTTSGVILLEKSE